MLVETRPRLARTAWGAGLIAAAVAVAIGLVVHNLADALPPEEWWGALLSPGAGDVRRAVVHYAFFPRLAVALLCGFGLGLSGAMLQLVLANRLAEPGTLGVFAGAKLALAVATLGAPALLALGYEPVATIGGAAALLLVLSISRRGAFSTTAVILAGLVVSLTIEATNRILIIWNFEALADLFAWQTGSLAQSGWSTALSLLPRMILAGAFALALARPLAVLETGEEQARGLGLPVGFVRAAALTLAALLGASVAAHVGTIAFLGLAGPAIAVAAGARTVMARLLAGACLSAVLLMLADQLALLASTGPRGIPTGSVTALLGAPVLVWLVARPHVVQRQTLPTALPASRRLQRHGPALTFAAVAALAVILVALVIGRFADGWTWIDLVGSEALLPWRAPRVATAFAGGAMLALAGVVVQRLADNPMASPELLGVTAGAAIVVAVCLFVTPGLDRWTLAVAAGAGSCATCTAVLTLGRRSGYDPTQMLLVGVALTAFLGAFLTGLLATGDPRVATMLTWLSGSTYGATARDAALAWLLLLGSAPVLAAAGRQLELLPLGDGHATSVGLHVTRARFGLIAVASVLTAGATLIVGPLSFVGLMGPHLVRLAGFQRPIPQLSAAALVGGSLMVLADWLGRMVAFPWQIPAGLVSALIGGAYLLALLSRR